MDPQQLRYTKTHEWIGQQGDRYVVGITKFAADQLTDVTYVELPHLGDHVFTGESFGSIETVKAVSDLYGPIDGEVVEVNEELLNDPNLLIKDPYGAAWLVKIKLEPDAKFDHLLTPEQYQQQVASEPH